MEFYQVLLQYSLATQLENHFRSETLIIFLCLEFTQPISIFLYFMIFHKVFEIQY